MARGNFDPKLVNEVIRRIENLDSEDQIDDFLKSKGFSVEDRHDIFDAADQMIRENHAHSAITQNGLDNNLNDVDFPEVNDVSHDVSNSNIANQNPTSNQYMANKDAVEPNASETNALQDDLGDPFQNIDDVLSKSKQYHEKSDNSKDNTPNADSEQIDEGFLNTIEGTQKGKTSEFVVHHISPVSSLIGNSFHMFFANFFKNLFLFFLHILIPGILYAASMILNEKNLMFYAEVLMFLFIYIYFISIAKFISEGSVGYLSSMKKALVDFIPISFTTGLLLMVSGGLLVIALRLGFLALETSKMWFIVVALLLILVYVMIIWYSLAFFVCINEREFYINAIARSRAYIKGRFFSYLGRISVFVLVYVVASAALFVAGILWTALCGVIIEIISETINADNINLNFIYSVWIKLLSMVFMPFMLFFMLVWPICFAQILYEDFSLGSRNNAQLSQKHQNLFFILLILSPVVESYITSQNSVLGEDSGFETPNFEGDIFPEGFVPGDIVPEIFNHNSENTDPGLRYEEEFTEEFPSDYLSK